tara:strand:+ start:93 stop:362 length:270 start_codon:yes stop_codon:yes gene_type:complete
MKTHYDKQFMNDIYKRLDELNKLNNVNKEKSDKIVNELDWTKQDRKDWEKFKKNLPKLIAESVIFGVFAIMFIGAIAFMLLKLLEVIHN